MPDYTKCTNDQCPHREACYRFTARSSGNQSYALFKLNADGTCDMYMEARDD